MKQSFLKRISAAAALLLYIVSTVGISVHNCDCTGHVCSHIALYADHIHESGCHNGNECSCNHHDCCHTKVFRVSISCISEDDAGLHLDAPAAATAAAFFSQASIAAPSILSQRHFLHGTPPLPSASGGKCRILRV